MSTFRLTFNVTDYRDPKAAAEAAAHSAVSTLIGLDVAVTVTNTMKHGSTTGSVAIQFPALGLEDAKVAVAEVIESLPARGNIDAITISARQGNQWKAVA